MSRVNPLTGEILDADIIVDSNMVRIIQQEYHALMETNNPLCENTLKIQESGVASRFQQLLESNHYCYGIESAKQAAMGAIALSILPNATPNNDLKKEYLDQYLRSLIAHEVGHVLGLRHNFHGSTMLAPSELNDTEITHSKGLVSSVMDYLPVNLAPPGIEQGDYFPSIVGPYDELAIKYGYKPNQDAIETIVPQTEKQEIEQTALGLPQPEFAYATDEDIRDINPDANVWDLSSDVLVYSQWQMDNARLMLQRLEKDYPVKENYGERRVLFDQILNYYFLNANLLTQYIGGQSFKRNYGDEEFAFVPVSLEKQRQALTNLQDYVFANEAFNFSPSLLNQLAPSRWYHWGNPIPVYRLDYPIHSRILLFQSGVLRSLLDGARLYRMLDIELKTTPGQSLTIPELFETLQNSIWTEVLNARELTQISSIRRSLQREHLNILLAMVLRNNHVPEDGRTLAWYQLRQLQKTLQVSLKKPGENLDLYTKAHLEETCDRIAKALNAQLQSN
ncbi:MAG TPA: peptidase M43, partial [Cyanobacteria bacterium UBA11368]|nr:peptidase M43 [Cyanobacteria bacterium UBA11368]